MQRKDLLSNLLFPKDIDICAWFIYASLTFSEHEDNDTDHTDYDEYWHQGGKKAGQRRRLLPSGALARGRHFDGFFGLYKNVDGWSMECVGRVHLLVLAIYKAHSTLHDVSTNLAQTQHVLEASPLKPVPLILREEGLSIRLQRTKQVCSSFGWPALTAPESSAPPSLTCR